MNSFKVLSVKVDVLDLKEILDLIQKAILAKRKIFLATVNSEFIVEAQKNLHFRRVLNYSTLSVPDTTGVVWAVKKLYGKKIERQPGVDLFLKICEFSAKKHYRIFLLGGRANIALQAKEKLLKKFKGLHIVGTIDGIEINPHQQNSELITKINATKPDLIFVALGAPKQELWIARNLPFLEAKFYAGIGGTLDFISGNIRRAPKLWRKIGLEWLWRLILQPSRIIRIFRAVIVFPYLVYKQKFSNQNRLNY